MKIHCKRCGGKFERKQGEYFCSDNCRKNKLHACIYCGKVSTEKYFCSDECRKAMKRARNKEYREKRKALIAELRAKIERLEKAAEEKSKSKYSQAYVDALEKEHADRQKFLEALQDKKLKLTRDLTLSVLSGQSFESYMREIGA